MTDAKFSPQEKLRCALRELGYRKRVFPPEPPSEANNWRGDKPGDYFVCARVMLPQVHLVGWMLGRDAQDQKYWKALPARPNRPAFFVDNDDLHSMDDLPKIENAQEQAA